ncbi:MAG: hypothetical protein LC808_32480 [Actinobacteria bacterium]|nr:hypothetical protein [Actinomycetota bacterium]
MFEDAYFWRHNLEVGRIKGYHAGIDSVFDKGIEIRPGETAGPGDRDDEEDRRAARRFHYS